MPRFDQLDQEARSLRSSKARFPGGRWKLPRLYQGITEASARNDAPDTEWESLVTTLKEWRAQKPDSITARVALAETYLNYAWKRPGSISTADKVTEEGWKLLEERLQLAKVTLEDASALSEKCPEWYAVMQTVAMGQSWDRAAASSLFEQAIAFEPAYNFYYRAYALYLLPKWLGGEGDSERFTAEIADKIGGQQGDLIYFEVARELRCDCIENMSWERIKRGYAAIENLYGTSTLRQNQFAYLAVKRRDALVAGALFSSIGERWDKETWKTQEAFEGSKEVGYPIG